VLQREQFLEQLGSEKRRADRSRAPLSLVVVKFRTDSGLDSDDLLDIVRDLSLRKRSTDFAGYLSERVIAFLLPYADANAAQSFSEMLVGKIGASAVVVSQATYADQRFDDLMREVLVEATATCKETPTAIDHPAAKSRWALVVKRAMDIVGAISLSLIFAPVMIATAVAIKLSSPGPIVFRQVRIGRDGVPFEFLKFRSMRAGVDDDIHREYVAKLIAGRHHEINEGDSERPVYKLQSDSRITPVGRILRKTSMDEMPQLFNVLRGEMSLVGPRPPIPYETEKYQSWHLRRLQEVRPGITGLWQVQGRSKLAFDDMVRLDLQYIRNWSLWLDIEILLKTIVVVIRGDGAD
jgi:exopolysaccharide biosynthesis polyprenyl glycosylphosphotransferase